MSSLTVTPTYKTPEVELALDRCVCYPSEEVKLYIRCSRDSESQTIFIRVPELAEIIESGTETNLPLTMHSFKSGEGSSLFSVTLNAGIQEFYIKFRVSSLGLGLYIVFSAWCGDRMRGDEIPENAAQVRLAVKPHAEYMRYLPELYAYDNFMNRFLMLFESFWKPINQQIGQAECYFDPMLTPESFLPWLGSWVGMRYDDTFPKDKLRERVKNAIAFQRSGGTVGSLIYYLEAYSGGKAEIRELKADNMVLGSGTKLGEGIALGSDNRPNTVEIRLTISQQELVRTGFTRETYIKKVNALTREVVPAHTIYKIILNIKN